MPPQHGISLLPSSALKYAPPRSDFKKSQTLDYRNGYSIAENTFNGSSSGAFDDDELIKALSQSAKLQFSAGKQIKGPLQERGTRFLTGRKVEEEGKTIFLPAHVAFDKTVLRFDAYFKQTVHDSTEQYHIRKVRILYFVEDDTISVVEPPIENSGIPQGILIKRQKLPKSSEEFFGIRDFDVGKNVTFYGKTFRIVSCDHFTQKYMLQNENRQMSPAEPMPIDQYILSRSRPHRIARSTPPNDKLRRFLEHDRQVLRFFCVWDDRDSMFGELREFVLHYYLVDDSIEVREVQKPNQGRDPFPILLRRQRLPKAFTELVNLNTGEMVGWRDLGVGKTVDVLGRKFLMRACDDYTKQYYKTNLNLPESSFAAVRIPELDDNVDDRVDGSGDPEQQQQQPYPPYNGFGTEEDSLGSCKYLVLKPPKKDFHKMLENENKVFRFVAVLEEDDGPGFGTDRGTVRPSDRRFVLSYHLSDDTLTLYEPQSRNSGIAGGKFLERTRTLKPGHTPQNPAYYDAADLYVGAKIIVNNHKFTLVEADEYVLRFMEEKKDTFWRADWKKVIDRICASQEGEALLGRLGAAFREQDVAQTGWVDANVASGLVKSLCSGVISLHEMITLVRAFQDPNHGNQVNYARLFC